ncbi:hypothetical protein MAPG_11441 [Magnaporthiopsis poae ATCC 64411]|uniref:Uncharacterized protein n=1 Tax=Magnaporthiopsis poae (strain ATCC 64411 / 73-15) TaxID=644358 RepID=A0A0C4EFA2_MAGP6|nr:hypothetical protein MAPG_11441 [Magnaporthiopsis poae ATCC 64411]
MQQIASSGQHFRLASQKAIEAGYIAPSWSWASTGLRLVVQSDGRDLESPCSARPRTKTDKALVAGNDIFDPLDAEIQADVGWARTSFSLHCPAFGRVKTIEKARWGRGSSTKGLRTGSRRLQRPAPLSAPALGRHRSHGGRLAAEGTKQGVENKAVRPLGSGSEAAECSTAGRRQAAPENHGIPSRALMPPQWPILDPWDPITNIPKRDVGHVEHSPGGIEA